MINEKRKYNRIKSDFDVRVRQHESGGHLTNIHTGRSINISATGILFSYNKPLAVGALINVRFLKPKSFDFFEGEAKVVRIEERMEENMYDIGVQFIGLTEEDKKRLAYYTSTEDQ